MAKNGYNMRTNGYCRQNKLFIRGEMIIMRNIKEYKTPVAEITEFECADIITESAAPLDKAPKGVSDRTYVNAGGKSWSDIYNK